MALTANIATIANMYVSVECPARLEASAHDTATSGVPAITAATAQYWWIHPRNRGFVRTPAAPSASGPVVSTKAIRPKGLCWGATPVRWFNVPPAVTPEIAFFPGSFDADQYHSA